MLEIPSGITVTLASGFPVICWASASASSNEWAGVMCRSRTIWSGASLMKTTRHLVSARAKIWDCHWSAWVSC